MANRMTYFSGEVEGRRPQEEEEIKATVWSGIRDLIFARIQDGSFGISYPITCDECSDPIGSDEDALWNAMRAEIPDLQERPWYPQSEDILSTLSILDIVQFCWKYIGKPVERTLHKFRNHSHLQFDKQAGQDEFRETINTILARNGLAYELTDEGRIKRLVSPVLHEMLASDHFRTSDTLLDEMLEKSREKFLRPDEETRREALETLWDAWERLKTLGKGLDKKAQTKFLLDCTAGSASPQFRKALDQEAGELTEIGNALHIRHSEIDQERLAKSEHVDYLFHRLLSLIQVILRTNQV